MKNETGRPPERPAAKPITYADDSSGSGERYPRCEACGQRLHVGTASDPGLIRRRDAALALLASGEIELEDALTLVVWPTPAILEALEPREAIAA